jgi:hypothetical protein
VRPNRLTWLLGAFAIVACPLADAAAGIQPIVLKPATFTRLPRGWHAFDRDFGVLTRSGGDVESYALSWAYKPNSFGWANAMPRNAIAVQVLLLRSGPAYQQINLCLHTPHLASFPEIRRLPLRLPRTTGSRLEGAPRVPEYRIFGRYDEMYNVDLRVDISNAMPTKAMLRTAQRIAAGLRFPAWPRRRSC